jgi:Domain of unknown function (DUF4468) with TBP-like fold
MKNFCWLCIFDKTLKSMRKRIFPAVLLFAGAAAWAQKESEKINMPFDEQTQKYGYTQIVETSGKSAPQLYGMTKDWCKKKYVDDKFSLDSENTELADAGSFALTNTLGKGIARTVISQTILYNIIFSFKDGRCRFQITDIKMSQASAGTTQERALEAYYKFVEDAGIGATRRARAKMFNDIDIEMKKLIEEVKTMLKGEGKKSDW